MPAGAARATLSSWVGNAGAGRLPARLDALKTQGARFCLSGMSARARCCDDGLPDGDPVQLAMPCQPVRLAPLPMCLAAERRGARPCLGSCVVSH